MMKSILKVFLLLISPLLLFGCGADKVKYEKGFPTSESPALSEFLRGELAGGSYRLLLRENEEQIYTDHQTDNRIVYYIISDDKMEDFYKSLLHSKNTADTLEDMHKTDKFTSNLTKLNDSKRYHLPLVELKKNNYMYIRTDKNETTLNLPDLLKKFDVKPNDDIYFSITHIKKDHFIIELVNANQDTEINKVIAIFVKQDLKKIVAASTVPKEFNNTLGNGELDGFSNLFTNSSNKRRYDMAFIRHGQYSIYDSKSNKLISIEKQDYLSKDGKYVYLGGNQGELEDGIQRIQTIENYLAGNDNYEREFKLSFKKIAKELKLKTSGISTATINYFNKDFVVLHLNYNGVLVGTAGATNVIVDLQDKDNPTAYIVDLGLVL
ncbi:hypothetical protein P5G51_006905 [Virgibacillus sp. 179-BFC.A HS]|uniref:DUF4825 domain-containing protein n=1 Tax=Tigheibacillus jepli TaxID=3035914 RepID=A0ABU5CFR2_9BACI|nr:hypothetical protein [Virgibacillus sp. 179-BFC.A HS]MDY0405167.1 hypothetical protein [Virgibacillus sp. 179-BFC.A HS]